MHLLDGFGDLYFECPRDNARDLERLLPRMIARQHLRAQTAFAVRRSRKLEELLLALLARGPLTVPEACGELRMGPKRLRCLLVGDGVLHHPERSAIPLGLLARKRSPRGVELHLTELGAVEASLVLRAREERRRI